MGYGYEPTHWLDHTVEYPNRWEFEQVGENLVQAKRAEGRTIQQGTPQRASYFNHVEMGILEATLMAQLLESRTLQMLRDIEGLTGEAGEVVIGGKGKYPFNEGVITVPLKVQRASLDYRVELEVSEVEDGMAETVRAYDKQKNGFKIAFSGSAKSVKIKYWVTGGKG